MQLDLSPVQIDLDRPLCQKYQVIKGELNQLPPVGSVGRGWIENGYIAFIPDNERDIPDDEDGFDYYTMNPRDMRLI